MLPSAFFLAQLHRIVILLGLYFLLLCTSHLYSRPRSSWKQPSENAAFCIVSAAWYKCQTYSIGKRCNVKHNRLRGETVVVLSTGYPPQGVAYSRHTKVPAVVRTSCLQMIRAVHTQTFNQSYRTSLICCWGVTVGVPL